MSISSSPEPTPSRRLRRRGLASLAGALVGLSMLVARQPAGAATPIPIPLPIATNPLVVSLGDSYAAGEGARGPVAWTDENCHRSAFASVPAAVRAANLARPGKPSIEVLHLACTGATINHGLLGSFTPTYGLARSSGTPVAPQLDAATAAAGTRRIEAMYISIGGNDIGFAQIAKSCWSRYWDCSDPNVNDPSTTAALVRRNLANLQVSLTTLLARLNSLTASGRVSTVYLTGYPDPTTGDDGTLCNNEPLWPDPQGFASREYAFASTQVIAPLNAALRNAVSANGNSRIGFLPAPSFLGRGVCSSRPLVNGVNILQVDDSFHPNIDGYQRLSEAVVPTMLAL